MHGFDGLPATVTEASGANSKLSDSQSILDEAVWRTPPQHRPKRVLVTRWRAEKRQMTVARAETPKDYHVVGITIARANLLVSLHDRHDGIVLDGIAMPGSFLVTEPGVAASCVFKGAFDELHLFLPNDLITECAEDRLSDTQTRVRSEAILTHDPIANQLARALLYTENIRGSLTQLYLDSIGAAFIAHLLSRPDRSGIPARRSAGLSRWRLKRAMEFIDANLAGSLTLPGIAQAVGLSSMHFAAQFRIATGLRPHEYVLRRRIERAQQMLLRTRLPIVEIALAVGFRSQSHFTAVFTKFLGGPPRKWREFNEFAAGDKITIGGNMTPAASEPVPRRRCQPASIHDSAEHSPDLRGPIWSGKDRGMTQHFGNLVAVAQVRAGEGEGYVSVHKTHRDLVSLPVGHVCVEKGKIKF